MFVLWISITAIVGVIVGALFSGKISKAVESLETTVETRLIAIETAIKARFAHAELESGAVLKCKDGFLDEFVEEIAAKVLAKLKAAEQTAKI